MLRESARCQAAANVECFRAWVYLAKDGKIKTIVNHDVKQDIVLLIDWWEHAWALDYQADKKGYLAGQWKIINWNVISSRVGLAS
jgi:superoxide dismutase